MSTERKSKTGRPPVAARLKRTQRLQILLTKAERKALNDYAARWSMTASEIVRDLIRTVLDKEGGKQ